jgi:hypothetical protein
LNIDLQNASAAGPPPGNAVVFPGYRQETAPAVPQGPVTKKRQRAGAKGNNGPRGRDFMQTFNAAVFVLALVLPPLVIAAGAIVLLVTRSRARRAAPAQEYVVH